MFQFILPTFLLILAQALSAEELSLADSFGSEHDRATARLIEQVVGQDSSRAYRELDRSSKAAYLQQFWASHNPFLLKFYYGPQMGRWGYSVSDTFFEVDGLIPHQFRCEAEPPDSALVAEAVKLTELLVGYLPRDPVALAAYGYALLEAGRAKEAEPNFINAVKIKEDFPEARNGWGLSYLKQRKRMMEALYNFRDAIATDPDYEAAWYDLAMCHLAMGSIDIDHRFRQVIQRFPRHRDAHYKLGVAYEQLYRFKKAAGSYSTQLLVNPDHNRAKGRLARVNLEMSWTRKRFHSIPELGNLVEGDRLRYLPLLGETYLAKGDYPGADESYRRYLRLLPGKERALYEDISLIATADELKRLERGPDGHRKRYIDQFWLLHDPTPTTPVNERRLEHYRRVYYATLNYSEGQKPWDTRGEVYIRFGHPDHRSWSDNLVFETDPKAVRVKNRLNELTFRARNEILRSDMSTTDVLFKSYDLAEVRGMPVFPVPHRGSLLREGASLDATWELWIYGDAGGGIEITFVDYLGDGRFDFARVPEGSPNVHLWLQLAPETVFAKATSRSPDHYVFDYGGEPLSFHLDLATFRAPSRTSVLELYMGIPWSELGLERRGDDLYGQVDRKTVIYDGDGKVVFSDSIRASERLPQDQEAGPGTLLIDQVRTQLEAGDYLVAVRVRDPGTKKVLVYRNLVTVESYAHGALALSDLEVAGLVRDLSGSGNGKFRKGDLLVIPMPSRTFRRRQPVYLYYEVYNLIRDTRGQTRYRVDYRVRGGKPKGARRLLSGVPRLLGFSQEKEEVLVSYEHVGDADWEPVYIALELDPMGGDAFDIEVVVTDLKGLGEPHVSKKVHILLEE